jgi:hypothetical protein
VASSLRSLRHCFDWNRGERFAESLREAAGYESDDSWLADLSTPPGDTAPSGWPLPPGWSENPAQPAARPFGI